MLNPLRGIPSFFIIEQGLSLPKTGKEDGIGDIAINSGDPVS